MAAVLNTRAAMAAHLASTTLVLSGEPEEAIREAERFLSALASQLQERKELSIKVRVDHPDSGSWTVVKIKCHRFSESTVVDVMEWRRYAGDCVLFSKIWHMFLDYLNNGAVPRIRIGEVAPCAPMLKPSQPPYPDGDCVVPPLDLDGRTEKRKWASDWIEVSEGACKYARF